MNEFVEHLHEVFERFGPIQARRMFGGVGIFHDGIMFALVAGDVLYLKADEQTVMEFEHRGLDRFEYNKKGKSITLSYFEAPEEIYDDPDDAMRWARRAFDAALRSRSREQKKARKKRTSK